MGLRGGGKGWVKGWGSGVGVRGGGKGWGKGWR